MKGGIHSDQQCPLCTGRFKHDENRHGLFCKGPIGSGHPVIAATEKFRVYFEDTTRRFKTYYEAERFLLHLRVEHENSKYDPRDYRKDTPLGFSTQADRWLKFRGKNAEGKVLSKSTLRSYKNYMKRAKAEWDQRSIKDIREAEIEDFLYGIEGISEKTRANHRSCLHYFFRWVSRREKIPMPYFPDIEYRLEYRPITDFESQAQIIDEIRRISYHINPKIWFGTDLLATYTNLRPQDLLRITEADVDTEYGVLTVRFPTKAKNKRKTVRLVPEHLQELRALRKRYPGLPYMPFFRHVSGISGVAAEAPFGKKYFYKWWKSACSNLGIENLDLYGGTRHTTTTGLAKAVGEDEARKALGNTTNKSIERYCQIQSDETFEIAKITSKIRKGETASVVELQAK